MALRNVWPLVVVLVSIGAIASDEGWLYYGGDQGGRQAQIEAIVATGGRYLVDLDGQANDKLSWQFE